MELPLHIILQKPPANVVFGLQKGSGNQYETVGIQTSGLNDLNFNLTIEVRGDKKTDEIPDFRGPFVQGPKTERFIYINIGTYAKHTTSVWGRRLKIPLRGINWAMVGRISASMLLQTTVPGTAKDGGPNCATVKPFDGWHVAEK